MDGLVVAWVGIGITITIQVVGVGIFVGSTRATLNGFAREMKEHKGLDATRSHGCPWAAAASGHETSSLEGKT